MKRRHWEESGKRGLEERREEERKEKSQKKEDTGARNVGKVSKHYAFQCSKVDAGYPESNEDS